MFLSIIIPIFNEKDTILELLNRIKKVGLKKEYEILTSP